MSDNTTSNRTIKGKRPSFFDTRGVDYLMHMVMVLSQELSVTRDRLDTLEHLIEDKDLLKRSEFDEFKPDQACLEERELNRQALITNLLSVMDQEAAEIAAKDTKKRFNEVIEETAKG